MINSLSYGPTLFFGLLIFDPVVLGSIIYSPGLKNISISTYRSLVKVACLNNFHYPVCSSFLSTTTPISRYGLYLSAPSTLSSD
jgi:hypothetical protein